MTSAIHFKFKSAKEYDSIGFEGDNLKVADLKVAIVEQTKLNSGESFDLEIKDAQTSEEYSDESLLVPKNTSVIVVRKPGIRAGGILAQHQMAKKNERYAETRNPSATQPTPATAAAQAVSASGPTAVKGETEEARIASLIDQSGSGFERAPYQKFNHSGGVVGNSNLPSGGVEGAGRMNKIGYQHDRPSRPGPNYVCHRCSKPGHWIEQCPTNGDPRFDKIKVRYPTGIPQSMLKTVSAPSTGTGLQLAPGQFVTLQPNEDEFARQTAGLRKSRQAEEAQRRSAEAEKASGVEAAGEGAAEEEISADHKSADDVEPKIAPDTQNQDPNAADTDSTQGLAGQGGQESQSIGVGGRDEGETLMATGVSQEQTTISEKDAMENAHTENNPGSDNIAVNEQKENLTNSNNGKDEEVKAGSDAKDTSPGPVVQPLDIKLTEPQESKSGDKEAVGKAAEPPAKSDALTLEDLLGKDEELFTPKLGDAQPNSADLMNGKSAAPDSSTRPQDHSDGGSGKEGHDSHGPKSAELRDLEQDQAQTPSESPPPDTSVQVTRRDEQRPQTFGREGRGGYRGGGGGGRGGRGGGMPPNFNMGMPPIGFPGRGMGPPMGGFMPFGVGFPPGFPPGMNPGFAPDPMMMQQYQYMQAMQAWNQAQAAAAAAPNQNPEQAPREDSRSNSDRRSVEDKEVSGSDREGSENRDRSRSPRSVGKSDSGGDGRRNRRDDRSKSRSRSREDRRGRGYSPSSRGRRGRDRNRERDRDRVRDRDRGRARGREGGRDFGRKRGRDGEQDRPQANRPRDNDSDQERDRDHDIEERHGQDHRSKDRQNENDNSLERRERMEGSRAETEERRDGTMDRQDRFGVDDGNDEKGDTVVDKDVPLDDLEDRGRRYGDRSDSENGHGSRKRNTPERAVRASGGGGYDPVGPDEGDGNTYKRQKTNDEDLHRDRNPRDSPERGRDYGNYRRDDKRNTSRDSSRGMNKDKRRDNRRWQGSNKSDNWQKSKGRRVDNRRGGTYERENQDGERKIGIHDRLGTRDDRRGKGRRRH
ncbi:hypothetical protein NDN08_000346 [Rhodosorus marinus]|uniref:DWNN domain-containing protein n=1 Tax=Rhodosorus marinus TaxID=101924 RepID=A0AAV8UMT5_9RHOD|nr:hypothetical protein NDN08_000346 [Rhodosorus marinus]